MASIQPRKSIKPPKLVYRIIANIDSRFPDAETAMEVCAGVIQPTIPTTIATQWNEDNVTPRICTAGSIKDCFTAIGVTGRFKRCLSGCRDMLSYAHDGLEVYPVLVQTFDGSKAIRPTLKQVPDWPWTNEFWITEPVQPISTELRWLDMYSLHCSEVAGEAANPSYVCRSFKFVEPGPENNHPWLNGKGHMLDSNAYETDAAD